MGYKELMLIDDDEDDQEIFLSALRENSQIAQCTTFSEASQALQVLLSKSIRPDVIFLDLNMPIMNGQDFLMEIKKTDELKAIPIIIFSTSSNRETIEQMKQLGAHDFITKPNNFDDLVHILKPIIAL